MYYPTYHFKKLFCEPERQAAKIREALAALSHCIYLQNNGRRVLHFWPNAIVCGSKTINIFTFKKQHSINTN